MTTSEAQTRVELIDRQMWLSRSGGVLAGLVLVHFMATGWLVYKVFRLLGKPDMDIR